MQHVQPLKYSVAALAHYKSDAVFLLTHATQSTSTRPTEQKAGATPVLWAEEQCMEQRVRTPFHHAYTQDTPSHLCWGTQLCVCTPQACTLTDSSERQLVRMSLACMSQAHRLPGSLPVMAAHSLEKKVQRETVGHKMPSKSCWSTFPYVMQQCAKVRPFRSSSGTVGGRGQHRPCLLTAAG